MRHAAGRSSFREAVKYELQVMEEYCNIQNFHEPVYFLHFGTVPHAGFGLGLERFVLFVTGMGNIRNVIPFPRTPGCGFLSTAEKGNMLVRKRIRACP